MLNNLCPLTPREVAVAGQAIHPEHHSRGHAAQSDRTHHIPIPLPVSAETSLHCGKCSVMFYLTVIHGGADIVFTSVICSDNLACDWPSF